LEQQDQAVIRDQQEQQEQLDQPVLQDFKDFPVF
jgi:hypothetical protein